MPDNARGPSPWARASGQSLKPLVLNEALLAPLLFVKQFRQIQYSGVVPKPQAAIAVSRIKRVMASVKLTLILHPPGAAENVKNLSLPQVKNLACGFGMIHYS